MFNFATIKLDKRQDNTTDCFVGIRKNSITQEIEFRLPHGFENFPDNDFNATKDLFFKMYRTFKKFEHENKKNKILDEDKKNKDNIQKLNNGYEFKDKEDNNVVLYSKISMLDNILDVYKDLSLDIIERQIGRSEQINYSKIEKYLDKAIYLDNDVIYIDEMEMPRNIIKYQSATLVDLFCFILYEVENQLEKNSDDRVKDLAYSFKEKFLSSEQSIFNQYTFEITIITLKNILHDIDKNTAYKDDNYWRLFEAIECFLYGKLDMKSTHENGTFWGINNFYQIWEDMCMMYTLNTFDDIQFADTAITHSNKNVKAGKLKNKKVFFGDLINKDNYPFYIKFRNEPRYLRPDLIRYYNAKNLFSEDNIRIEILTQIGNKINFKICLNNKKLSKNFEKFNNALKEIINLNMKTNIKYNIQRMNGVSNRKKYEFIGYDNNQLEKIKNHFTNSNNDTLVIDFKYLSYNFFFSANNKLNENINKQLCYEYCLNQSKIFLSSNIENHFIIPYFYKENNKDIRDFLPDNNLYYRIRENKIKIFQANFQLIQEEYLKNDN